MPANLSVISLVGMVIGLLSLFSFCLFFVSLPMAVVAVVLGHVGLREIQKNRPFTEGVGFAVTALVSGYLALLLSTTVAVLFFVLPNFTTPSRGSGLASQEALEGEDGPLVISEAGSEAFKAAEYEIASKRDQPAGRGNSDEAKILANEFSQKLKELSDELFTASRKPLLQLSDGEYLTYCELHEDQCLFLVHVPSYRKFTGEAKKTLAEIAWAVAQISVAGKLSGEARLGVGLRGVLTYGDIMLGTSPNSPEDEMTPYRLGEKDDLVAFFKEKKKSGSGLAPSSSLALGDQASSENSPHDVVSESLETSGSRIREGMIGGTSSSQKNPTPAASAVETPTFPSRNEATPLTKSSSDGAASGATEENSKRRVTAPPEFENKIPIRLVRKIENEAWPYTSLAMSHDGKWLAAGKLDQSIYVFDLESGAILSELKNLSELGQITSLAFSSTGKELLAGGYSGQTACWGIDEDGRLQDMQVQYRFDSEVQRLLTSPKYSFLLGTSRKGTIAWQSFGATKSQPRLLQEFQKEVLATWLPTANNEALSSDGSRVVRFSLNDGEVLESYDLGLRGSRFAGFSQSGDRLAVTTYDSLHFFQVEEKKESGFVKLPRGETIHALGFHPNEKWVALGMRGKVAIYDIEQAELLAFADTESVSYQNGLVFSTDGKLLATISQTSMDPIKIIEFGE